MKERNFLPPLLGYHRPPVTARYFERGKSHRCVARSARLTFRHRFRTHSFPPSRKGWSIAEHGEACECKTRVKVKWSYRGEEIFLERAPFTFARPRSDPKFSSTKFVRSRNLLTSTLENFVSTNDRFLFCQCNDLGTIWWFIGHF